MGFNSSQANVPAPVSSAAGRDVPNHVVSLANCAVTRKVSVLYARWNGSIPRVKTREKAFAWYDRSKLEPGLQARSAGTHRDRASRSTVNPSERTWATNVSRTVCDVYLRSGWVHHVGLHAIAGFVDPIEIGRPRCLFYEKLLFQGYVTPPAGFMDSSRQRVSWEANSMSSTESDVPV